MIKKIIFIITVSLAFVLGSFPNVGEVEEIEMSTTAQSVYELVVNFDVPLGQELQEYIFELCEIYKITPTLVFAVIEQESDYNLYALNGSENCFGLMQINECNFTTYNLDEPYNGFENVRVGITMLSELLNKYEDVNKALMAYNCGEYGAKQLWKQGITSTSYSRSVLEIQKEIVLKERFYYVEES